MVRIDIPQNSVVEKGRLQSRSGCSLIEHKRGASIVSGSTEIKDRPGLGSARTSEWLDQNLVHRRADPGPRRGSGAALTRVR